MKHNKETQERILKAGKIEFSERGYEGARMSRIAELAEANKAMIHYYYKDKHQLYEEVVKRVFGMNSEASVPIFQGSWDLNTYQKFHAFLYFLFKLFSEASDTHLVKFFFWEMVEDQRILTTFVSDYIEPKLKSALSVLEKGISEGVFECANPKLVIVDIFYFSMIYLARKGMRKNMETAFFFKNETSESVYTFLVEHAFKTVTPAGKTITIPDLPSDLIMMLNSVIIYLAERKNEGIAFKVIDQLETIINS